jgi:hypothetical protein
MMFWDKDGIDHMAWGDNDHMVLNTAPAASE